MPELPEVETVRRLLDSTVRGRTIRAVRLSGLDLRQPLPTSLPRVLRGRTITSVGRHGKYLLIGLDGGLTLLSHLGMSGRWLLHPEGPVRSLPHVHVRIRFDDGAELWFQDTRRFGLLRAVRTERLNEDPLLALLGPDPIASPPSGESLRALGRRARVSMKNFLMDQRRVAGVGNIYASEILHRAGVDPRRRASALSLAEWDAVARQTTQVLEEATERLGTTFRSFRTPWNEPGGYGEQLRVYDRAREPCRRCGTPIRRIVQNQRSTFFCPSCQGRRRSRAGRSHRPQE
ncbi:MAG TPA: bifunctional DNA-formamidopyrimidine glycosylase/DNA-(apurinic or apyrimidinic site) lyase [Candidatus Eisenbacteria bacterium]|jgi:formamidopyrimidine-DNA glycosylase